MSAATLLIIVKILEPTKMFSAGKCINKLWYIQTTEYYLALKRNELAGHKKTCRDLKCILLVKEASLGKKNAYCMIPAI